MSRTAVRSLLERHGLHANRDLGQNFLVDPQVAERLVAEAGVGPADRVIEIGAGLGVLTRALAARAKRVVAIEIDSGLVRALAAEGELPDNVELLHADALELDLSALARAGSGPVRVVANLPYSVSSPLLRRLLEARAHLVDWSVLLQREVARRLLAQPATRDYGSLTVLHQLLVEIRRGIELAPGCFFPVPRVVSQVVHLAPRADPLVAADELEAVERFVRAAFAQRRKTLANALGASGLVGDASRVQGVLHSAGLDPRIRAEALDARQLLALARALGVIG